MALVFFFSSSFFFFRSSTLVYDRYDDYGGRATRYMHDMCSYTTDKPVLYIALRNFSLNEPCRAGLLMKKKTYLLSFRKRYTYTSCFFFFLGIRFFIINCVFKLTIINKIIFNQSYIFIIEILKKKK